MQQQRCAQLTLPCSSRLCSTASSARARISMGSPTMMSYLSTVQHQATPPATYLLLSHRLDLQTDKADEDASYSEISM